MSVAIEVDDLRKTYAARAGDPVQALDGVSFQVPQGANVPFDETLTKAAITSQTGVRPVRMPLLRRKYIGAQLTLKDNRR